MKMAHQVDEPDPEDDPPDSALERTAPPVKKPSKLKYQHKGFRIESSKRDREWKLVKYYRSEADMRKAYRGHATRASNSYIDIQTSYRMVFPDGAILPKIHDPGHFAHWEYRRLRRPL